MTTATINPNGGTTARINATTRGPQKVSVTTPTAQLNVAGVTQLRGMTDVNASTLEDGALLQYDSASDKFVTKTTLESTTGTLKFNGGNF